MRTRTILSLLASGMVFAPFAAPAQDVADQPAQLAAAKAQSLVAAARSVSLEHAAAGEQDQARQARALEAAVAARIEQAEADFVVGQARMAIVERSIESQRAHLAEQQQPVARLLAALQSFVRRPAIISVAQPGSIDDLVHVRAVLASTFPVIRARTRRVRTELSQARMLRTQAVRAGQALAESRARLDAQRLSLARLEAAHRARGRALGQDALFESDRAIALGENARDIVASIDQTDTQATTQHDLTALPGPQQRPLSPGKTATIGWAGVTPAYRLPVTGQIVTGFGALSDAGARSRGITLATAGSAGVVAPAAGRIAFAGPFRGYGTIVIIDHGNGWTSLITGLGDTIARVGQRVAQGTPIGAMPSGSPRVTVELRRRDRPIDMMPLIG